MGGGLLGREVNSSVLVWLCVGDGGSGRDGIGFSVRRGERKKGEGEKEGRRNWSGLF